MAAEVGPACWAANWRSPGEQDTGEADQPGRRAGAGMAYQHVHRCQPSLPVELVEKTAQLVKWDRSLWQVVSDGSAV
jgi:hypothetical protein